MFFIVTSLVIASLHVFITSHKAAIPQDLMGDTYIYIEDLMGLTIK